VHELGIAQSIVAQVYRSMAEHDLRSIAMVGVRIGVMAGVMNDALLFSYEAITRDTPLAESRLVIIPDPLMVTCRDCSARFEAEDWVFECNACGSSRVLTRGGDDLRIAWLDTEAEVPA
jgi:hydrogenase nickel incorporation protein HypA/HybF